MWITQPECPLRDFLQSNAQSLEALGRSLNRVFQGEGRWMANASYRYSTESSTHGPELNLSRPNLPSFAARLVYISGSHPDLIHQPSLLELPHHSCCTFSGFHRMCNISINMLLRLPSTVHPSANFTKSNLSHANVCLDKINIFNSVSQFDHNLQS